MAANLAIATKLAPVAGAAFSPSANLQNDGASEHLGEDSKPGFRYTLDVIARRFLKGAPRSARALLLWLRPSASFRRSLSSRQSVSARHQASLDAISNKNTPASEGARHYQRV
jgi:hypothetical protein